MADRQQQLVLSELNAIIVEILLRLPAKSLVRFRCVSKAWRDLIWESYFIKNHLSHNDTKNILNSKLLLSTSPPQAIDYAALSNLASSNEEDDGPVASREVDYPVDTRLVCLKIFVGSCNGLVCLLLDFNFVLLNPCTRVFQSLPSPTLFSRYRTAMFYGFGYDSATDDCKIVVGSYRSLARSGHRYHFLNGEGFKETMIEVFALKTGSWRTLERLDFVMLIGQGCVVNGALHWLKHQPSEHGLIVSNIMCFDLAEEKFREIAFPCPLNYAERDYFSVGIGAIRDCLTVYFEPDGLDYRMWVMKEYGVKESWAEIIRIPFEVLPQELGMLQPLFMFENDEVLMTINWEVLALYNPKENTFRNVFKTHVMNGWRQITTYIETLVSPLIGAAPNLSNQHCESFTTFV
ncbi:putative F-box domain-containing protein [Rosa chinensis]|uniref:Putative F-box domain-containing protein n=1 Tax=Rosa chinensis TaxID=74649 RepID=A0A2P6S102_ROSCH|nr:F-box/kelch-repeat protein At3g23880 [Rosa chinensis]PRQ52357.1 putative F-box domain-containing protein [Rosa chinensis]